MPRIIGISVIIPAHNEGRNLALLLPELKGVLDELGTAFEILIVCRTIDPATAQVAAAFGARTLEQEERGYGGALIAGFDAAQGEYFLTIDADLSHKPVFIRDFWAQREGADVLIASRYVHGGRAIMPLGRYILSRALNSFFSRGLNLGVDDMSSGFRLYRAATVSAQALEGRDFDVLQELLVRAYVEGWRVREIPFTYVPRRHGNSNARIFRFGLAYLRTFRRLWRLRNSRLPRLPQMTA